MDPVALVFIALISLVLVCSTIVVYRLASRIPYKGPITAVFRIMMLAGLLFLGGVLIMIVVDGSKYAIPSVGGDFLIMLGYAIFVAGPMLLGTISGALGAALRDRDRSG